MRLPDFDLERAGEGDRRLRSADLVGRPWIGYFGRHPGCNVCQRSLRGVLAERERIRELDGELIVFFNARGGTVSKWFARTGMPEDLPVVADPDAILYRAIGTRRARWYEAFGPRALGAIGRAALAGQGGFWTFGADNWRLGADLVVDERGIVVSQYLAETFDDRATPGQLVRDLQAVHYRSHRPTSRT